MIGNDYYSIAVNDYEYLTSIRGTKFYNQVAPQCQQICEKLLKSILVTMDVESRFLKSHSLTDVYKKVKGEITLTEKCYLSLARVTDFYFNARYPGEDFITLDEDDIKLAYDVVDEVYKVVSEWRQNVCKKESVNALDIALQQISCEDK